MDVHHQIHEKQIHPGISNISYRLIKKGLRELQLLLIVLANYYIKEGIIPDQWKLTSLYPILKPSDWDYSIAATQPIILIECTRKIITKVVGNRLSDIISKNQILKDPNYAGLKNENTAILIHILNSVMEEAKERNQELWIIMQDMAKAYDSVGLMPLCKALGRIKIPTNIVDFIISLFYNRQIRIITSFGLLQPFTGPDGIDQGETISPLLLHIFYDPLLC